MSNIVDNEQFDEEEVCKVARILEYCVTWKDVCHCCDLLPIELMRRYLEGTVEEALGSQYAGLWRRLIARYGDAWLKLFLRKRGR